MNAAIEELEQALTVRQRKLSEHRRELERLIEKTIVERNIRDTESEIQDIEASIIVLKSMAENS
ncbi:hypothetical protein COC69_15145 [Bacillus cereus]|uniref:Uncharacterized protein n=1 Tax=Bacillus cereus TaxID=1396 RepID=A0A9X7CMP0_BACCE|nr:hypothetical protein [Bacillus cereus]PGS78528.1 hypothetical protein COC69_15145 [Bacillus cereus]